MVKPNADRLIVALDLPVDNAFDLLLTLRCQDVDNFKIGVGTLLSTGGLGLARAVLMHGAKLMLDLKLYDTRDTVRRTMESVAKLGAYWVTVHADCAEHAIGFGPKVLSVRGLTDGNGGNWATPGTADGIVCGGATAAFYRSKTDGLIVCPGIRRAGAATDNHYLAACTPGDAIHNGADYIVVGRPIYAAADPVAACRQITREIKSAELACPKS